MKKLLLLVGAGVGYVMGTKAGRQRYEQMRRAAQKWSNDPRVQEKAHQAADLAKEKAPVVKDKITGAAGTVAHKVRPSGDADKSADAGEDLNPESLHFQENPYPQGDLP